MRALLAIVAMLALLFSPVTASAAQASCARLGGLAAMSGMDMSAMHPSPHAGVRKAAVDPCCDQSRHHKMSDKNCAQACAASWAAVAALPMSLTSVGLMFTKALMSPPRLAPAVSYQPSGLERPPKSRA